MRDELVRCELTTNAAIHTGLIRHQRRLAIDVGADNRHNLADASGIDVEGASLTTTLYQRQDSVLMCCTATAHLCTLQTANVGFINFNVVLDADSAADPVTVGAHHARTQFVQDLERGFIAIEAKLPLELDGRQPGVMLATRYAPQNHVVSGVRVRSMTVPAVKAVSCRHARQRRTPGRAVKR